MAKTERTADEAQIRALVEDRVRAVRAKDLPGVVAHHAPDVLAFDVLPPLHYAGTRTVKERAEAWFSGYRTSIGYEVRDLRVTAGDDVAFCHSLVRVSGTTNDGGTVDMWVRATVCFRKLDGRWQIVHEHQSVPFDPKTGQASLDLQP